MTRDDDYLEQLKAGHPAAFERLVDQFEGPLYRFFVCHHGDHHTAQEQMAETFAQLVRSLPKMRGDSGQLCAYVFAVARHTKMRRWRRPAPPATGLREAEQIGDSRPSPHVQAAAREQIEHVLAVIRGFDAATRDVLLLRFVEGYSIDEVAAALEIPPGTVKSHIHRGRARLKQKFSEKGCET